MTTSRRLLTALTATAAATAALVLVSPPGVQAAPKPPAPQEPATSSMSAPYRGAATFESYSRNCEEPAATCTATGAAEAATGRSAVTGSYYRRSPTSGDGSMVARSLQEVSYAVPRGAKTVTAVLQWRVDSASAAAVAAPGYIAAHTGLAAAFSYDSCDPPECDSSAQHVQVATTYGPYYTPGPPQRVVVPRTETLTLTASGTLPATLLVEASTYVIIHGSGNYELCLNWDGCSGPSVTAHAGTGDAHIDATLLSVQFSAS